MTASAITTIVRVIAIALLSGLLWPEVTRYRAEHQLAAANGRIERVLRGLDHGADAVAAVNASLALAHDAAATLPGDARPAVIAGVALLMLGRGAEAVVVLEEAIQIGERPELTINLGRALGITGDEAGMQAAYLRTAWASPAAIATLPKAIRNEVLVEVQRREVQLRAGTLQSVPTLPRTTRAADNPQR